MNTQSFGVGGFARGFLVFLAVLLIVGCGKKEEATVSPLPTPTLSPQIGISPPPTPPSVEFGDKLLMQTLSDADSSKDAMLEVGNPDGNGREALLRVSAAPGAVALSRNQRYIAFFTADMDADGALTIWNARDREIASQLLVPAETSESFRDAPATRYLAWSPDDAYLAYVVSRDLYVLDMGHQATQLLVPHQTERYNMAGWVMGSVGRPTWAQEGDHIVYDAFLSPDFLSDSADTYRAVMSVRVSDGMTATLLANARVMWPQVVEGERVLMLKDREDKVFKLDLENLEIQETDVALWGTSVCDSAMRGCAAIEAGADAATVLQITTSRKDQALTLADFDRDASACAFQSVLWHPDGGAMRVTIGCADDGVSLWSVNPSNLNPTRLATWADVMTVRLVGWFK